MTAMTTAGTTVAIDLNNAPATTDEAGFVALTYEAIGEITDAERDNQAVNPEIQNEEGIYGTYKCASGQSNKDCGENRYSPANVEQSNQHGRKRHCACNRQIKITSRQR